MAAFALLALALTSCFAAAVHEVALAVQGAASLWRKGPLDASSSLRQRRTSADVHGAAEALRAAPALSGLLCKQRNLFFWSWPKRFTVIQGHFLYYYARREDHFPRGVVCLDHCTVELNKSVLELHDHINGNVYRFASAGGTEGRLSDWFKALASLCLSPDSLDRPGAVRAPK